jgi:hypothetical protein
MELQSLPGAFRGAGGKACKNQMEDFQSKNSGLIILYSRTNGIYTFRKFGIVIIIKPICL